MRHWLANQLSSTAIALAALVALALHFGREAPWTEEAVLSSTPVLSGDNVRFFTLPSPRPRVVARLHCVASPCAARLSLVGSGETTLPESLVLAETVGSDRREISIVLPAVEGAKWLRMEAVRGSFTSRLSQGGLVWTTFLAAFALLAAPLLFRLGRSYRSRSDSGNSATSP